MVLIDAFPMVFPETHNAVAEMEKVRLSARFKVVGDVVDLVEEMSREDPKRRGRGLVFVIGAVDAVMDGTFQVDEDPLKSLPVGAKSIYRDAIRRTLKRAADTEGIFLLDIHGRVVASGLYPRSGLDVEHVREGDTRYRLAMTLTEQTLAYAIVLAHNGNVLVYRLGGVVSEIVCAQDDPVSTIEGWA